ncbi:MAG: S-layer homology domain-containing protein, partial [Candidatus Peribacteraceae bacterium]|nr:S-layer homology domain-containing protein [Candidatus Peribacteraceae bacterium]
MKKLSAVLFSLLLCSSVSGALASRFSDVPDGHLHFEIIEALVDGGLIQGYSDGTFRPDAKVNRAEMLKMLYKATGKVPDASSRDCFPDIESGSWYEAFVCDAAAHHYVAGYSDGMFKPANAVNRVEALKMITEIFGIPVEEVGESARQVVKFVDVSISAWYTRFLYAAYVKGILPIPGQDTARFYPDWPLLRGEAAAMIFNGLQVDLKERRQSSSSSTSRSSTASSVASSESTASSVSSAANELTVAFPFEASGKFSARKPFSYRFTLDRNAVISTVATLQYGQPGSLSCRLYLLGGEGF